MNELERETNYYDYKLKINIACAIKNIISLICFTILAIIFNKWWLVLLTGLFLSYVKDDEKE